MISQCGVSVTLSSRMVPTWKEQGWRTQFHTWVNIFFSRGGSNRVDGANQGLTRHWSPIPYQKPPITRPFNVPSTRFASHHGVVVSMSRYVLEFGEVEVVPIFGIHIYVSTPRWKQIQINLGQFSRDTIFIVLCFMYCSIHTKPPPPSRIRKLNQAVKVNASLVPLNAVIVPDTSFQSP